MGEDKGKGTSTYDSGFKEVTFFDRKLIFRQPKFFRISIDLVIFLSKIRGIKKRSRVIEIGGGFGFLSIAIAKLYRCKVVTIERDGLMYELLEYNIKANGLSSSIIPVKGDIRYIENYISKGSYDVCVINPPFYKNFSGNVAKEETDTSLSHFLKASSYSLRDGGYLNIFFIPQRLHELFIEMERYNFHPSYLCFLLPHHEKRPNRITVSARKNVKGLLEVDKAFFINDKDKKYSNQTLATLKALSDRL